MGDLIYYSELFDYYGSLFTETQKIYFEDYYFNNLTMDEIALNNKVSKNAVSKTIKDVKSKLDYYEQILKLKQKKDKIKKILSNEDYQKIESLI